MINIQDSYLLVIVSISLFFLIICQIPNSYSQLYSNENIANTYEKEVNKGTYNSNNNNEKYFDKGSDNLKTDNFNDKNSYLYSDNISNQESVSKEEDNENFNLKDYAQSITQLYKKQTNNQELDSDKSLYYKQNNNNIPYPSANDNDLNNENDDGYDSYNSQSGSESLSGSKSISSQEPSVDTHYVQVFDKNGNFIKSWGDTGKGEGNFLHPHGIAVDSKGCVYVTDEMRSKVLKFDSDGNFIKEWGEKGYAIDQFSPRIEDIDVDSQGNVYVVDYGKTTKILKFDSEGTFIFSLGSKGEG